MKTPSLIGVGRCAALRLGAWQWQKAGAATTGSRRLAATALAAVATCLWVPVQAQEVMATDLREHVEHITVHAKDLFGHEADAMIPVTIFKPQGRGPFPLAIISHGRESGGNRATQGRQRFESLARYMVAKGFIVYVPTRMGYGETYGQFDPETPGRCDALRPAATAEAASDQIIATVQFASGQNDVDASRWVAIGQSVGGLATVALASRQPPGLVAAINFSGGVGGDPEHSPGAPCSPEQISRLWQVNASHAKAPSLWLYWQNDKFWGADNPRRWYDAWTAGGGTAEFHSLPAAGPPGTDGHTGMTIDMDTWAPLAEAFLAKAGFTIPGIAHKPAASGFAPLDDVSKVPTNTANRELYASRFLAAKGSRAFAIGAGGAVGWATGDWALARAMAACNRRSDDCKAYAVDSEIVWAP